MRQVRLLTIAAVITLLAGIPLLARQAAPGAPANLVIVTSPGGGVSLQWTHSTGTFTHYIIEAAVGPGGPPILRLPTSSFANGQGTTPGYYGRNPDLVPAFTAAGIGAGDYFVRIIGVNGTVESGPSNEVVAHVRAGCFAPAAPTNFTQIVRGVNGWLMWNPGSGGAATAYVVRASFIPNDPAPPVQLPLATPYFNLAIPPGAYYVNVVAVNACGISGPSNELIVTSPADTPLRTPNPPAGERLPMPFVQPIVAALASQARAAGLLVPSTACPTRNAGPYIDQVGKHELEARKTQLNPYINYIVDGLRQIDQRFGYNAKPTRAWVPSIIAGDEITYHFGADAPEGSPNAYAVDVLNGHCSGVGVLTDGSNNGDRHTPDYRVFFDEFVRWTGAGRF